MLIIVRHLILIIERIIVLDEGPTQGINNSTGAVEKKISKLNFSKANARFCLSLRYSGNESYLYVNKIEIYKFKAKDNISWYKFCVGSVSKDFTKVEQNQISLNGTVYEFS